MSVWSPSFHFTNQDDSHAFIRSVENDRRWPALRQELFHAGIPQSVTLSEIFDAANYNYFLIFNDFMKKREARYLNQIFIEPVKRYFPQVKVSNWNNRIQNISYPVPDINGYQEWLGGTGAIVGMNQAPAIYGWFTSNLSAHKLDGKNYYLQTAFNALRYDVNVVRASVLGSTAPTDVWIQPGFFDGLYKDNDYYQESIFHALLSGAQRILFWNPSPAPQYDPTLYLTSGTKEAIATRMINQTVDEFNSIAGYADLDSLVSGLQWWGDDYVMSCATANAKRVCRVSTQHSISDQTKLTIINGTEQSSISTIRENIVFDNGRILISSNSDRGLWIIQPLNAEMPKIQRK